MKSLAAVLAALLATTGVALAAGAAPKQDLTMPSGAGAVTFRHPSHAAISCETCHPGGSGKPPRAKDAAHELCRGCHERGGQGPTRCNDCHDTKRR